MVHHLSMLNHSRYCVLMANSLKVGEWDLRDLGGGMYAHLPFMHTDTVIIEDRIFNVELTLDMTSEGIRPVAVEITSDDNEPVSSTDLRAVPLGTLTRRALREELKIGEVIYEDDGSTTTKLVSGFLNDAETEGIRAAGPVDNSLTWVGYFYRMGQVLGLPPAKQVEIELGLPRTTASKWIRKAREKGFLDGKGE